MKAAVLRGVNEAVQVEEVPTPVLGPGEALVKIAYAALNHRDVWIRKGQYAGLKFPITLGSDGCGVVESVADEVDAKWVGQEVVINPSLGWGPSGAAQDMKTFNILGLPADGTLAEYVKVPVVNLHQKPAHLTGEEAAAIPLAGLTAYRALVTRAGLHSTDRVLITGIGGGAATFAAMFADAFGAEVWVTSGSDAKIEAAKALCVKGGVNYRSEGWVKELKTLAGGFDVIIDSACGSGLAGLIDLANPGGRIAFFGATSGNPDAIDMRRIFWKQLSLLGTTMGSPDDFQAMLSLFTNHKLKPSIDSVYALTDVNAAFDHMEAGNQSGKIVVKV